MSATPFATDVLPAARAFLTELIDYAGLFPPAGLPMETAIHDYARYRHEETAWMLGRFICPAGRLESLREYHALFARDSGPFRFSVLAPVAPDADAVPSVPAAELDAVRGFEDRHGSAVRVEILELKLPPHLLSGDESADAALFTGVRQRVAEALGRAVHLFFEVPLLDRSPDELARIAGALGAAGGGRTGRNEPLLGMKLRLGGLDAAAFPSPAQVAAALVACRDHDVPFKATAGLHHPVRHFSAGVQAHMHGFMNVFGGALLAARHALPAETVEMILADEDAVHFRFEDDSFSWRTLSVNRTEIEALRRFFAVSYGSCSFDEPREDLLALGILPLPDRST